MRGNLLDAPKWATHYVERVDADVYWFINFDNYRWTCYNEPDEEFVDYSAENLVNQDIPEKPEEYLVIELPFTLENE